MKHYEPIRTYETVIILRPTLTDVEIEEYVTAMKRFIEQNENEILKVDLWGRRRLAYPIRRFRDGVFAFFIFRGKPAFISELTRQYRITEDIIRYLTTIIEGDPNLEGGINDAPPRDDRRRDDGGRRSDRPRPRREEDDDEDDDE